MSSGPADEQAVAQRLSRDGYKILDRNWRTRSCELDIVARRGRTVYFVEVKYRRSDFCGDGFSYITVAKRRRLRYGARLWSQQNGWVGEQRLLAASVSGLGCQEIELLEIET